MEMVAAINQDDASIYHSSVKSLLTHLYQISIWSILILNLPRDSGESSVLQPHICLETKELLPYGPKIFVFRPVLLLFAFYLSPSYQHAFAFLALYEGGGCSFTSVKQTLSMLFHDNIDHYGQQ